MITCHIVCRISPTCPQVVSVFFFFFFFRLSCILADFWTPSVHLTCHGSKQLQDGTWQLEGKVLLKGGLYYRDEVSWLVFSLVYWFVSQSTTTTALTWLCWHASNKQLLRASCLKLEINECRCYEVKLGESEKRLRHSVPPVQYI